jgi:hypothetical protein
MSGVFGDLNVRCFDGWAKFVFKDVRTVNLKQLFLAVNPLVNFTGDFLALGRLPGSMGVPVDGGVAFRPNIEELAPDGGEHRSYPSGAGVLGVLIANFSKILVLEICPFA